MIDVQIMSRLPIQALRTHRQEVSAIASRPLFCRDCLEVDVDVGGKTLTLYVNHFKSMIGGRAKTLVQRNEQASRVAGIINERWAPSEYQGNFAFVRVRGQAAIHSREAVAPLKRGLGGGGELRGPAGPCGGYSTAHGLERLDRLR